MPIKIKVGNTDAVKTENHLHFCNRPLDEPNTVLNVDEAEKNTKIIAEDVKSHLISGLLGEQNEREERVTTVLRQIPDPLVKTSKIALDGARSLTVM